MIKTAVLCDLHLPLIPSAAQYAVLDWAVQVLKEEKPDLIVINGDITALGESVTLQRFENAMQGLTYEMLLGNAEIREVICRDKNIQTYGHSKTIRMNGQEILLLSTPTTKLSEEDKALLLACSDGATVFTHQDVGSFVEESKVFLTNILNTKKLLYIHGHKHEEMESFVGKSRTIGVRGLDPDKVYGMPAVSFFNIENGQCTRYERQFEFPTDNLADFREHIGISCYHAESDISYAIEHKIPNIEVRLRTIPDDTASIQALVETWRAVGGRYLSVHLPDLKLADDTVDTTVWDKTIDLAKQLHVNGVTIHVPKTTLLSMIPKGHAWRLFSEIMYNGICRLGDDVKVGIENMHMLAKDKNDENRGFGYAPEECIAWINELNTRFGYERVGAVLDVGHASNNGSLSSWYVRSMWYELMGKKTVAYHIHQVTKTDKGLTNHHAIENWLGDRISYVSFFWAWQENHLNHVPMFLEMSTPANCQKSFDAFDALPLFKKP